MSFLCLGRLMALRGLRFRVLSNPVFYSFFFIIHNVSTSFLSVSVIFSLFWDLQKHQRSGEAILWCSFRYWAMTLAYLIGRWSQVRKGMGLRKFEKRSIFWKIPFFSCCQKNRIFSSDEIIIYFTEVQKPKAFLR